MKKIFIMLHSKKVWNRFWLNYIYIELYYIISVKRWMANWTWRISYFMHKWRSLHFRLHIQFDMGSRTLVQWREDGIVAVLRCQNFMCQGQSILMNKIQYFPQLLHIGLKCYVRLTALNASLTKEKSFNVWVPLAPYI